MITSCTCVYICISITREHALCQFRRFLPNSITETFGKDYVKVPIWSLQGLPDSCSFGKSANLSLMFGGYIWPKVSRNTSCTIKPCFDIKCLTISYFVKMQILNLDATNHLYMANSKLGVSWGSLIWSEHDENCYFVVAGVSIQVLRSLSFILNLHASTATTSDPPISWRLHSLSWGRPPQGVRPHSRLSTRCSSSQSRLRCYSASSTLDASSRLSLFSFPGQRMASLKT